MQILTHQNRIQRPERIFQTPQGRKANQGQVQVDSGPQETIQLEGRQGKFKPLTSLSGKTLLSQASESALRLAGSTSLPAQVTSNFAPAEFLMLNSGDYHGAQHPINVADTVTTLAKNSGRSEERAQFLGQVALIHDADERILMDGQGNYSYKEGAAPARVPVTLAWMDKNQGQLQERFEWGNQEFKEAKALIAGTEHPLNDTTGPKRHNNLPGLDGKSAAAVLKEQLQGLPKDRQSEVLEEVQLLRFADQSAEYLNGVDAARTSVIGLASEIGAPQDALLKGTPGFLSGLGRDNEAFGDLPVATSQNLVKEMDLQAKVYSPEELHGFLSDQQTHSLESVKSGLS